MSIIENPWFIGTVLIVGLFLAMHFKERRRHADKLAKEAKQYREWSVEAMDNFERFYVAREAAVIAFLYRAAGMRSMSIITTVSEPIDCYDRSQYAKGDRNRRGLGGRWNAYVCSDCGDGENDPRLMVKYAYRFARYALRPLKMYDDQLFVDLLQELVLRESNRQAMELTRSWLLPDLDLLMIARADAAAGRIPDTDKAINAAVAKDLEHRRLARVPQRIDIFFSAQKKFDHLICGMQDVIDANKQGIEALRLRILSQECVRNGPYEKDHILYADMTQTLSAEDLSKFFTEYESTPTTQEAPAAT